MGFGRFLVKLIPFYNTFDAIKKVSKHGLVDGIKEKAREDWLEDMPGTSHLYKAGKSEGHYQGKKDGYVEASYIYEKKLISQAEAFLRQTEVFENQKAEYNELLTAYEEYIEYLENRDDLNSDEVNYKNTLIVTERKLKNLAKY